MHLQIAISPVLKELIEQDESNAFLNHIEKPLMFYLENLEKLKSYDYKYIVSEIYRIIDNDIKQDIDKEKVLCKSSCSLCCGLQVSVTPQEAINIYNKYKDLIDWEAVKERKDMTDIEYFRDNNNKCMFLKDNKCSIYQDRPMSCRKYFVQSRPELCGIKPHGQVLINFSKLAEIFYSACITVFGVDSLENLLHKINIGEIEL